LWDVDAYFINKHFFSEGEGKIYCKNQSQNITRCTCSFAKFHEKIEKM
jgi:hypothetical protein